MHPIKAVLLATSESNNLRPLTESMPAPMVPVVNRPVMAYMVELLARQGIKEIVVSLYHLAGQIEAYFGNGRRWGVSLEYALQNQPLGTAGSLKWAQSLLPDTFLVLPADGILDLDFSAALAHHRREQSAATVIRRVIRRPLSPADGQNNGSTPRMEPAVSPSGAYIFNSRILELAPARMPFDIEAQLLPAVRNAGLPISSFDTDGYGNRLESFEQYREVQHTVLNSRQRRDGRLPEKSYVPDLSFFSLDGRQFDNGIWIGRNQVIHPTARLRPPVHIGDNSYIGSNVELGPDTVIGSNVVIDDEATVSESTILDGTYVGELVNVERRLVNKNLIIDLETADYTHVADEFLLGQSYRPDVDRGLRRVLDVSVALFLLMPTVILSLPVVLLLLATTGKPFRTVERQFNRPLATGGSQPVILRLYQFNVEGSRGGHNLLGRFLSHLEIDRWPEWLNLLKGDLALVGVKPLSPAEIGRLDEPWQQPRHEQRPGVTGLWYTNTRRDSLLDEYVVADIYYLATRSWREDLKILLKTPFTWFKRIK